MFAIAAFAAGCGSTPSSAPPPGTLLQPGEVCDTTNSAPLKLTYDPPELFLAPHQTRSVIATAEPDLCTPITATFASGDVKVAQAPGPVTLDLRHQTYAFTVTGGDAAGATTLTGNLTRAFDNSTVNAPLPITVLDGAPPSCTSGEKSSLGLDATHTSLPGPASIANASLSIPPAAFTRADMLAIPPFTAQVACADDLSAAAKLVPIGPAVAFTAALPVSMSQSLRREIDFAIPVNPASIPDAARMRHLQVLFKSAVAQTPRSITVANPRIEKADAGGFVLRFSSPWFGTYQPAFAADAGTHHASRHLTHRAVIGFSMGGGGSAALGLRHHDMFDAIAPMGGPSDWTWMLWYVEHYALGGFCPASDPLYPNCAKHAPDAYPIAETFAHTMDWNHWWYETGSGNGGTFARGEYTQIFGDLALMAGSPGGQNADPTLAFFPAGPKATDPWVKGDTTGLPPGVDCRVTVDPIKNDPNETQQQQWQQQCNQSRCDPKNAWIAASGYYDGEYNVDGTKQVISFCDGNQNGTSPYVDTWAPPVAGQAFPVSVALAVDLNKNGVRDMDEPILRQGHEPWDDSGPDGLFDAKEPGYDPILNPDPSQDDYDFQVNPNGTENNHHYDAGEPWKDLGLDGVAGTPQQKSGGYDVGEGDGQFTVATGLTNFYAADAHNILHQWVTSIPAGPMTDAALARFDSWSDGGVRDLFNFAAVANHLEGSIASRRTPDGRPIRSTAFYDGFQHLPGQDATQPDNYAPDQTRWADVADSPSLRYGDVDASPSLILQGDGQHVGTGVQALYRLESGIYFVAHRWPDADKSQTELTSNNPESTTDNVLGTSCEIAGKCETIFTGPKTGRSGPIAVQLPPGYALAENRARNVRYPVVYVLHGYGQDPRDLEAIAIVSTNFMNDGSHSTATRLPKFLIVYVDGRCRISANGHPECIRGTFYLDSNRDDGAHIDSWFAELVDYVDKNYRTMGPSDVDVTD